MSLDQVYPFSTQDGKAIPLDIIRPSGLLYRNFTELAESSLNIPDGYPVAAVIADKPCLVKFAGSIGILAEDIVYSDLLIVPANTITIVSLLSGVGAVKGLTEAGTIYVQLIKKWAGLALDKQFTRK